jgi:glycosyltransferase involved in cell wall biosynthesis
MARKIARRLLYNRAKKMWTKWEEEIVSQHPTITVSNSIADEIRRIGNNNNKVFVVPNYPLVKEVGDLKDPFQHETLSSVYAGTEAQIGIKLAHRNMDGLVETFTNNEIGNLTIIGVNGTSLPKVKFTGYLSRQSMYNEMSNHSIGLVPFKKHWSHVYINPNKAYEYAHAGLFVLCTSSFKPVTDTLEGNCSPFEDYSDLVEKMEYYKNNIDEIYSKRIRIFEFAKSNLIWEKTEFNIFDAYRVC